jgi:MFS transporter, DHA2 family, methylenomycin A resistance protein
MGDRRAGLPLTLALCGGYFLVLLDVTVVNVALPAIGGGLHASAAGRSWVVDAYTVPLAALLLASGAVGDRLGHRRVVITGFAGFGVASVLCAVAPSVLVLSLARAVQGTAAALMLPGTLAVLTESAGDERDRARLVGVWAAVGGAALPAGPVVGGLLVQQFGWPAVFWLNVPVTAVALVPLIRRGGSAPARTGARRIDWPGAVLLSALIGGVVTAIIEAREDPALATGAAVVAGLAAGALVLVERRASDPLVRVAAGVRRPLGWASGVAGLMNLCTIGVLFVLTQLFQDVRQLPPLGAGALLLATMLPLPLLGRPAATVVNRLGAWSAAAIGLAVSAAGFAVVASTLTGDTAVLVVGLVLWGTGLGVLTPAIVTAALRSAPESPGTASGASNTARQVGGAVGVAVAGTIAGGPDAPSFADRTAIVVFGAAVAYAIASGLSARQARLAGHDR